MQIISCSIRSHLRHATITVALLTNTLIFARLHNLAHIPALESTLILFCTYLATKTRSVGYSTIKSYLCAIRFHCILARSPLSFSGMDQLYYLLRGIKIQQGAKHTKPKRSPITPAHLAKLHGFIQSLDLPDHDRQLYWSASTLAFFGLLRVSEYTCARVSQFDPTRNLAYNDVSILDCTLAIFIKASKNDPFRQGTTIYIGSSFNILCPVAALTRYLRSRNTRGGPLFAFKDGTFLTRQRFVKILKACFTDVNLNTHSFRIGGASALSAAGVSDSQIQIMGRWSSNCFVKYLRLSRGGIVGLASVMTRPSSDITTWTPRFNRIFT